VHMAEQAPDRRAQAVQNAKRGAHWTPCQAAFLAD
jgi:hypothetical protein